MKITLFSALFSLLAMTVALPQPAGFTNPIAEGADPWVIRHDGKYLWCFSEGNRGISVWVSDRLTSLGVRHVVWEAPESGPFSREVWAPEMHLLDGKWYIYFAASDGRNENHLAYALESRDADPLGPYELRGPFATGDGADGLSPNLWAIDMTVLDHGDKRYAIWSGWDAPGTDHQFLYIAPMASPAELAGPRVRIAAHDDYLWERTDEREGSRGLNEAPQILKRGDRTFVIYSCGASWKGTYKLGLLELTGADPLNPASWEKHPEPVFRSSDATLGVGHGTFVPSPDDSGLWHVFHAKVDARDGWRRAVFLQPLRFAADGFPDFGRPVAAGEWQAAPSGQAAATPALPFTATLKDSAEFSAFSYYGHQQFLATRADGTHLGIVPAHPVNDYRSGEKLVLDGGNFTDVEASVRLHVVAGDRDAGLLFRVSRPAVGFDAQQGYFAGIVPGEKRVILGKTDGKRWQELARADVDAATGKDHLLGVRAVGDKLTVFLDGREVLSATDSDHASGSIGIRVVGTHARFSDLKAAKAE